MKWISDERNRRISVCAMWVIVWTTLCILIGVYFDSITAFLSRLRNILRPILYGLLFALICSPFLQFGEAHLTALTDRKKARPKLRRILALIGTYIILLAVITLFISLIVPQVVSSYLDLQQGVPSYVQQAQALIDRTLKQYPMLRVIFKQPGGSAMEAPVIIREPDGSLPDLTFTHIAEAQQNEMFLVIRETLIRSAHFDLSEILRGMLQQSYALLSDLTPYALNFLLSFVSEAKNLLIGLIISIYILYDYERLLRLFDGILRVLLPSRWYHQIRGQRNFVQSVIFDYISGKLLDAFLIGYLAFFLFWVTGFPYVPLLGVILAIANIIPYVGLFLGAVPCLFIVIITSPGKTWLFFLIVLVLHQIELRIIEPYVLRSHTWLSPEWVIISVILFSGLFGFGGMFLAAPVFTVLYHECKILIEYRLSARSLPTETEAYLTMAVPNGPADITAKEGSLWKRLKQIIRPHS